MKKPESGVLPGSFYFNAGDKIMINKDDRSVKRSLEIVHEGINFDFCRKVTLNQLTDGYYKVKMEAFIMPKRKKDEY